MTPLPASAALDAYFLEARSRLLDLAAILDRIDRGTGTVNTDVRLANIQKALTAVAGPGPGRAGQVQLIFSLPYDPKWPVPAPK